WIDGDDKRLPSVVTDQFVSVRLRPNRDESICIRDLHFIAVQRTQLATDFEVSLQRRLKIESVVVVAGDMLHNAARGAPLGVRNAIPLRLGGSMRDDGPLLERLCGLRQRRIISRSCEPGSS